MNLVGCSALFRRDREPAEGDHSGSGGLFDGSLAGSAEAGSRSSGTGLAVEFHFRNVAVVGAFRIGGPGVVQFSLSPEPRIMAPLSMTAFAAVSGEYAPVTSSNHRLFFAEQEFILNPF